MPDPAPEKQKGAPGLVDQAKLAVIKAKEELRSFMGDTAAETRLKSNAENKRRSLALQLDATASIEEQRESMEAFHQYLETVLMRALNKGTKYEELASNPLKLVSFFDMGNPIEAQLSVKLSQLVAGEGKAKFLENWPHFCEKVLKNYETAAAAKEALEKGQVPENTEWMSDGVRATLIAVGALGLFSWLTSDDEQEGQEPDKKEKKSFPWFSGAAAMLGVGALIGDEAMGEWMAEHMGIYLGPEAMDEFVENIKGGHLADAVGSLRMKNHAPWIKEAATTIGVSKELIMDLKNYKYSDITTVSAQVKRTGRGLLHTLLGVAGIDQKNEAWMSFTELDDGVRLAGEESKLMKYLKENEAQFGDKMKDLTLAQILAVLMARESVEEGSG
jgi:hypothetical protein